MFGYHFLQDTAPQHMRRRHKPTVPDVESSAGTQIASRRLHRDAYQGSLVTLEERQQVHNRQPFGYGIKVSRTC